jgi:hypothetical protein
MYCGRIQPVDDLVARLGLPWIDERHAGNTGSPFLFLDSKKNCLLTSIRINNRLSVECHSSTRGAQRAHFTGSRVITIDDNDD